MLAVIAIAIFPVLTLLLVGLTRAENMLGSPAEVTPAPLRLVDAPVGDVLPRPAPRRLAA